MNIGMKRLVAGLAVSTLALSACGGGEKGSGDDGDTVKIGLLLSLTGAAAPFGIPERDAAEAAVKAINEDGGIDGRDIEVEVFDDGTDPTLCTRGVTSLVQKGVVAIVGGTTGSCTLAAGPIALRSKVPMLAPNGTIEVTDPGADYYPYVFRSLTSDVVNTEATFKEAVADGAERVAVFYQEDAYGENGVTRVEELADEQGITVVAKASAPLTSTDVAAQATQLRNADPDVVLVQVSSPAVGAAFVRGAAEVGLDVPMWGSAGLAQRPFIEAAGPDGEGFNMVGFGNPFEPGANAGPLVDLLPNKQFEGFAELISSNGVVAIAEAAKKVDGDLTGESLRDALEGLCDVKTYAEGTLCYSEDDHDGWSEDSLVPLVIKNSEFVTQK